jgi:hypothetical protein
MVFHWKSCPELKATTRKMTSCLCEVWRIHSRKRDDIRSSGFAQPGETPNAVEAETPNAVEADPPRRKKSSSFSSTAKSRCWIILQFFILLLIFGDTRRGHVMALQLPDIYWNSSNPIFRIDNTDHIIDVNKNPAEYDRVNIYCPQFARISSTSITDSESISYNKRNQAPANDGYYIIYNVSKEEYETCRINNPSARRMLVCDNPLSDRLSYVTITFRPFSPQPNGPEFHAGNDYYFIATSTGTEIGLDNKVGGRCASHNMKLVFKVAGKDAPDDATEDVQRVNQPLKTDFRLPGPEQLPAYGRVDENALPSPLPTTTIPFFFRWRTTPTAYRPRIMKYTPLQQPPKGTNVINTDNNDLPGSDVQSSDANDINRSADSSEPPKSTTNDYFNLIREEDAAVPGSARQTKSRANDAAAVKCQNCASVGLLLAMFAIQRMFQNI